MATADTVVITFYTLDTHTGEPCGKYATYAAAIEEQCEQLGVRFYMKQFPQPETDKYLGSCRIKPLFIRDALETLDAPVLWLDADAELRKDPRTALRDDMDFMGGLMPANRIRTWHVGTLFFNNTPAARALLDLWIEHLEVGFSDESALHAAWSTGKWKGRYMGLPKSYYPHQSKKWRHQKNEQFRKDAVVLHHISNSPEKTAVIRKCQARVRAEGNAAAVAKLPEVFL